MKPASKHVAIFAEDLHKGLAGIFLLAFLFVPLRVAHADIEEQISNFRVDLNVQQDATIRVTEFITYDFGQNVRHGIYRTIPIKYTARGGTYAVRISDVGVLKGQLPAPFTTSTPGRNLEIKIGDAGVSVTGEHTYAISYTVDRAINYFDDHDEVYWNATGNEWRVSIANAEAAVRLPGDVSADAMNSACFVGTAGSTLPCDSLPSASNTAVFHASGLDAQEGLTVVVGFPKGVVHEPSAFERILATMRDNSIVALPLVVFAVFFWLWWTRGRDPKSRGTIIAEYDAPDDLTPPEVGTLMDERVDRRDIAALLIHLAVKGYLDITREEKRFDRDDYLFKKLKDEESLTNDFEKTILGTMFGKKTEVRLSDLKEKFHDHLARGEKQLYESVVSKGYFVKNPTTVRAMYTTIGIIGPMTGLALTGFDSGLSVASFVLSSILILIFALVMPKKTAKGVLAKEHALGLKMYLTVAEKDRLKFHNAPTKNPKRFEALLPYAIALGVEKEWAKQFEGLDTQPPSWYHDPNISTFSTLYFTSALSNFGARASSVMSSHPSSAASGRSGFGGGGFSGGGFGGGGGGSW